MIDERVAAGCEGKTPYQSRAAALRVLRHRQKMGRISRKGRGPPVAYKCRNCRAFHIGSDRA